MNQDSPILQARFLHPRYWLKWLLFGAMILLAALPYRLSMGIGRLMGRLLMRLSSDRRHIAQVNLQLCFPGWPAEKRQRVLRQHFESLGMALVETSWCWWARARRRNRLLKEVRGEEHLEAALSQGRGALLLAGHFTHLEMGSTLLAGHRPTAAVYRPHKDALFEAVMARARRGHGMAVRRDDIRGIVRALRGNLPLWYAPDQDYRGSHTEFVPFFGVEAATNAATGKLARMSGAPVLPFYQERLADGSGYRLVFMPALENFPGGDSGGDAQRVNEAIEMLVLKQPADYLWVHRRFKTTPSGKNPLYPRRRRRRRD